MTPCKYCTDESLRYCRECAAYFCTEHICEHLTSVEVEFSFGSSWLSIPNVIANMSDDKLAAARLTLSSQLYAIDAELFKRRFDSYRKTRPQIGLQIGDLTERKRERKTGVPKRKLLKSEKQAAKIAGDFTQALASLDPQTLRRVQEALRKKGL